MRKMMDPHRASLQGQGDVAVGTAQQVVIGEQAQRFHRHIANREPFSAIGTDRNQRCLAHPFPIA